MLRFLFPGLTAAPERGERLFAAATARARKTHWYVEGQVPDTIDGRFRMLASIAALLLVRLERAGDVGNTASVALTERFIQVMESEHREIGLGDPALGRTVRKLVGSLARRVELWRSATGGAMAWDEAARQSAYQEEVDARALQHTARALNALWLAIEQTAIPALMEGSIAE